MSRPVSPMAVGGFVLGALALLVTGLLLFGGQRLFADDKLYYVIFFDSSLNGLEVGAPVKMQGVKIGTVSQIRLEFDDNDAKVYKPVVVEIDRRSFTELGGHEFTMSRNREQRQRQIDRLVQQGFRARLEMQSLLTGLLYVDFGVYPDKPAQYTHHNFNNLIELPYIPTTVDELRSTAEGLAEKLRKLPLDKLVQDFGDTLAEIRRLLASQEMQRSNVALAATLQETQKAMSTLNRDLGPLLQSTSRAVADANTLARESTALVQDARKDIKPVLANAEAALSAATAALNTANATLGRAQGTLGTVDGALGPDSPMTEALLSLRDTARSLKNLTDYLERHPEALLSGKPPQ